MLYSPLYPTKSAVSSGAPTALHRSMSPVDFTRLAFSAAVGKWTVLGELVTPLESSLSDPISSNSVEVCTCDQSRPNRRMLGMTSGGLARSSFHKSPGLNATPFIGCFIIGLGITAKEATSESSECLVRSTRNVGAQNHTRCPIWTASYEKLACVNEITTSSLLQTKITYVLRIRSCQDDC